MKGYPTIVKKAQKRLFGYHRSRTYKSAYWEPEYTGSKKYVLQGDEIKREPQYTYRITWRESFRDEGGKIQKAQTHLASMSHWDVVEDFKEWLLFRQGEIEGNTSSSVEGFTLMKRSHLPGDVPNLENAIREYLQDGCDEKLQDSIEKKLFRNDQERTEDDWEFVMAKIFAKWLPIKESIVRSYTDSEEFRVWLDNEATRKAGPRKPTEEELKEQAEADENLENMKAAFGPAFSRDHENHSNNSRSHTSTFSRSANGVSAKNSEMAQEVVKAGYRQLSRKYHPDLGGDMEMMKQLNETVEELSDLIR